MTQESLLQLRKVSLYLTIFISAALILYFGKPLFIPMSFGLLTAIICYPFCKWLESKNWPRTMAVSLLLSLIILIFFSLVWMLAFEFNMLLGNFPLLKEKFHQYFLSTQSWISDAGINAATQNNFIENVSNDLGKSLPGSIKNLLNSTSVTLLSFILIPIFASLFLIHRETFVNFLMEIAGDKYKLKIKSILQQSILTYFRFIKGTFFVYCIVGLLNSLGLVALGIENAFVFGMITAFMTIIPYIGIIISAALPVTIALITKDSIWYSVGVIVVFSVVQYLEANIIFPRIVGQQLNLSTWAVLVSIITGTLLWGLSGMILFIPFVGILKIFTDNIDELRSINLLLSRGNK